MSTPLKSQQNELMWECSNDYDTEVTYQKGTAIASANQGVCAGLSIEWCKNILKSVRPETSKPFLLQGMLYQRFYDWGTDDATRNAKLFATAGVTAGAQEKRSTAHQAATYLWAIQGVFWGGYNVHAVAAAKTSSTGPYLFFDPNYGCYAVHSEKRLTELFRQGRKAVGAENWMEFYAVTLA